MSLVLLFHYLLFNMFRMLVHPSSGACDTLTPTHIEPEQYNTWNKSTISRKFLKMDVLTFETCWAVNSEIIKEVTSSWSIFIQQTIVYQVCMNDFQGISRFMGI